MKNVLGLNQTDFCTNQNYWDCECEKKYIHHKSVKSCDLCNTSENEQPDSAENEIESGLFFAN